MHNCKVCHWEGEQPLIRTQLLCPVCHADLQGDNLSQESVSLLIQKAVKDAQNEVYSVVGQRLDELEYRRQLDVSRNFIRVFPKRIKGKHWGMAIAVSVAVILYLTGITAEQRQKHADKFLTDLFAGASSLIAALFVLKKDDE